VLHDSADPDIDRESLVLLKGEQEDAVLAEE
jgi:hypothetical protein